VSFVGDEASSLIVGVRKLMQHYQKCSRLTGTRLMAREQRSAKA
jgi:hypothetical protein